MNINYYNPYVRAELELYHYGRPRQRWGVRNGPPYPLGKSQLSSAERKADPSVSEWTNGNSDDRSSNRSNKNAVTKSKQNRVTKDISDSDSFSNKSDKVNLNSNSDQNTSKLLQELNRHVDLKTLKKTG